MNQPKSIQQCRKWVQEPGVTGHTCLRPLPCPIHSAPQPTTQHTGGEWSRNIPPASKYPTIFAGRNTHVCTLSDRPAAEMEANARLIAASPDLLEACRKAYACASLPDHTRDLIRAAIAKAGGHGEN